MMLVRIVPVALVLAFSAPPSAFAQADAAGKALPDPNLSTGTVTIRVVDGAPSKPLPGLTVQLVAAKGKSLAARTNPQGRATFSELAPSSAYVGRVSIDGGDGKETKVLETEPFRVPATGGLRFMLSPSPLKMPGMQAPAAPAASGAPRMDPRRASGIPRADQQVPPSRLTVRAILGDFSGGKAPSGAKIHLLGYGADGTVTKDTKVMDDGQRVAFDGLITGGRVVYYVVATFQRNGVEDRLMSQPITMPPRVGMRLLLAGLAPEAKDPAIDDLAKSESTSAPASGRVLVNMAGRDIEKVREVELVEIGRPDVVAKSPLRAPTPTASDVQGLAREPQIVPQQSAAVAVTVKRAASGTTSMGLPGISITLRAVEGEAVLANAVTGADGSASIVEVPGRATLPERKVFAEASVFGKTLRSKPFALPPKGGVHVAFDTAWRLQGLRASFDGVVPGGDHVYVARVRAHGRMFRSSPFQLTAQAGAHVNILVFPGLIFAFHGGGEVDDQKFWFQNQFTLYNPGKQPFLPEGGSVDIPLPTGFTAAQVRDEDSTRVQQSKTGLVWRGPVPPGPNGFIATFALPVEDGQVNVEMPLPMGAFQSQLIIRQTGGMTLVDADGNPPTESRGPDGSPVKVLMGVPMRETKDREGRPLVVLSNLSVPSRQSLSFGIRGLPQRPAWQAWLRWSVGILVLGLIAWGIYGLGHRTPMAAGAAQDPLEQRREELLDRIVALEKKGDKADEVDGLKSELADLYREIGSRTES